MSIIDCLRGHIKDGIFDENEIRDINARYNDMYLHYKKSLGDHNATSAAATKFMEKEVARLQQDKINTMRAFKAQVDILKNIDTKVKTSTSKKPEWKKWRIGYQELLERAYSRKWTVLKAHYSFLDEVINKYKMGFGGIKRETPLEDFKDIFRVVLGGTPEIAENLSMGKAVADAFEYARKRFVAAGGVMGDIANYAPQAIHNRRALIEAGFETWRSAIMKSIDLNRMIDPFTGMPFTVQKMERLLPRIYADIVSDGKFSAKAVLEAGGELAEADIDMNRASSRFFVFKDPETFFKYNEQFGVGDDGLFDLVFNYFDSMARDTAMLEVMGPRPMAVHQRMMKELQARGGRKGSQGRRWVDGMFQLLSGAYDGTPDDPWLQSLGTLQNVMRSAYLGGGGVAALGDSAFMVATARMNGLPAVDVLRNYGALFNPLNEVDRQIARDNGYILDLVTGKAINESRFTGENMGGPLSSSLVNATVRLSGLHLATKAAGDSISMGMETHTARLVKSQTSWANLQPEYRDMLNAHGIKEKEWSLILKINPFEHPDNGVSFIRSRDIELADLGTYMPDAELPDPRIAQYKNDITKYNTEINALNSEKTSIGDPSQLTFKQEEKLKKLESERQGIESEIQIINDDANAFANTNKKVITDHSTLINELRALEGPERLQIKAKLIELPNQYNNKSYVFEDQFGNRIQREKASMDIQPGGVDKVSKPKKGKEYELDIMLALPASQVPTEGPRVREGFFGSYIDLDGFREINNLKAPDTSNIEKLKSRQSEIDSEIKKIKTESVGETEAAKEKLKRLNLIEKRLEKLNDLKRRTSETLSEIPSPEVPKLMPVATATELRELASKYDDLIHNLRQMATNESSLATRAISTGAFMGDAGPNSVLRAFSSTAFMFKTFPIQVMFNHLIPATQKVIKNKGIGRFEHLMTVVVGTTLMGAGVLHLKAIAQGKTPPDMDNWKFWKAAMLQGGAGGLVGDTLLEDHGYGSGPFESLIKGPAISFLDDGWNVFENNFKRLQEGRETKYFADGFRFLRKNTPFHNLVWTRLITDRFFLDEIEQWLDPDFYERLNRKQNQIERDFNQRFFWEPGEGLGEALERSEFDVGSAESTSNAMVERLAVASLRNENTDLDLPELRHFAKDVEEGRVIAAADGDNLAKKILTAKDITKENPGPVINPPKNQRVTNFIEKKDVLNAVIDLATEQESGDKAELQKQAPLLKQIAADFIRMSLKMGYTPKITDVVRTKEEAEAIYKKTGVRVTPSHLKGRGVDFRIKGYKKKDAKKIIDFINNKYKNEYQDTIPDPYHGTAPHFHIGILSTNSLYPKDRSKVQRPLGETKAERKKRLSKSKAKKKV